MAEAINCRQCDTPMGLKIISPVNGEEGGLKVSIADFPGLECQRGHRQFITRDFPMQLLEQVSSGDRIGLPAGTKQGLLFKKHHCGKCGAVLTGDGEPRPFFFDVQIEDASNMRVELTVPVYRCVSCGQEQVRESGEVEGLAPVALAHAFQAAGIQPQA